MKANESVSNFYPTMRMYTNFAVRNIKKICAEIGPREAGSEAEEKAQDYIAQQIGDAADEVKKDTFRLSPRAFLGWLRLSGIFLLVSTVCGIVNLFVFPQIKYSVWLNLALDVLIFLFIVLEFLFYKEFTDPVYPKATSHNTYCIRRAEGETKRRIIIGGHADSSIEWMPTHVGGSSFLYFSFAYPIIGFLYNIVISVVNLGAAQLNNVLLYISCAFIPSYIILILFMNYKVCVDGANDNLTGCLTSAAVMKFLGDNKIRFANTEVVVLLSGAEEAGLRGAKAAAKQHPEFRDGSVETVFIAMDTLRDYENMAIYDRDMSGLVKNDDRAGALLKAGGKLAGMDIPYAVLFAGATDAAAMTQAGIPSGSFCAMYPGPPKYYHTRDDRVDILEPKTVEKCLEIALQTVFLFDEQGLKTAYETDE
ncbi:MAG: M20/M25/M40 family metallo-hydrolase [Clostridia bacterium]|nr:M20/M25/M40 family metallo-hydrolase [Clostridia bacterium]